MRVLGDIRLVRDQHNRVSLRVQLVKKTHDLYAGLGVKVACRLIRQNNRRAVDQRARNGDSLALTARELIGLVVHAVGKANVSQRFNRALHTRRCGSSVVDQRQLNIVQ